MAGRKSDFTLPTNTLDDLFSTQEERDDAKLAKIRDIPLTEIDNFPDHPFKVRDDEDMLQLVESVKERGVITPATVRQKEDGRYELVSGHRRKRACELAGFETLRCEVVDLDRDAATILMVESNYQRSQILPSEKAFEVMGEIARQAGDRTFVRWLEIYRKLRFKWVARKLAGMLHCTKHIQVTMCLSGKLQEASAGYGDRSFGKEADEQLKVLVEKARGKQAELKKQGTESEVLREEPFTIARDSLGFKVYLMKWNKGRKDCTVEIEEI